VIGRISCVVFDIDDTLYPERQYVLSGFLAVSEWLTLTRGLSGFRELAEEEYASGTRGKIFDRVLERLGVSATPELVREMVMQYRRHQPAITLLPDSNTVLDSLRGRARMAAVSDGPLESQEAKVAALSLGRWLDPVVLTSRLGEEFTKPHRRAFEVVEEACACWGDACVYVADNPKKDFAGPSALGWRRVRIRRHDGEHSREPSGADVEIELPDLRTLNEVLRAMR